VDLLVVVGDATPPPRLVARARPSSVLATDAVRQLAGDDGFTWSQAGRKRIKGISEPVAVWRCRRAE